jgi:hypothetical protein
MRIPSNTTTAALEFRSRAQHPHHQIGSEDENLNAPCGGSDRRSDGSGGSRRTVVGRAARRPRGLARGLARRPARRVARTAWGLARAYAAMGGFSTTMTGACGEPGAGRTNGTTAGSGGGGSPEAVGISIRSPCTPIRILTHLPRWRPRRLNNLSGPICPRSRSTGTTAVHPMGTTRTWRPVPADGSRFRPERPAPRSERQIVQRTERNAI